MKSHTTKTKQALSKLKDKAERYSEPLDDPKKEMFCQYVITERSMKDAAVKVGYLESGARVAAFRLAKDRNVQGRIAYLLAKAADQKLMRRRDVLRIASERARACYIDVVDLFGLTVAEFKERMLNNPARMAVKEIKCQPDDNGVMRVSEIKFHDPREAYRDLGEYLGWAAPEKVELSGQVGIVYLPTPQRVTSAGMETS